MKRTLCCLALLFAVGCSNSPTAPTPTTATSPTPAPTAAGPTVLNLQWGVVSPSCGQVSMPPVQPAFSDATIVQQADGSVMASWPYQNRRLYARFLNVNNTWGLCSWDIADV